jgi:hypothetical protein
VKPSAGLSSWPEGEGKMIRKNRPWTPEEDNRLRTLLESGASITLVAAKLKRSINAVRAHATVIGLSFTQIKLKLRAKK